LNHTNRSSKSLDMIFQRIHSNLHFELNLTLIVVANGWDPWVNGPHMAAGIEAEENFER
jgi:hypothetical protein